jgi:hypothetical protein
MPGGREPKACLPEKGCQSTSSVSLIQWSLSELTEPVMTREKHLSGAENRKSRKEMKRMVAYQLYLRNAIREFELVGVLPERRTSRERITDESIVNWAREGLGRNERAEDISLVKVDLEEGEQEGLELF